MRKEKKFCFAVNHEKIGEGIIMTFSKIFEYGEQAQKKLDLTPFYKAINCNLIESISFYDAERKIGIEFICDEEGTFVEGNPIYLVDLCIGGAKYTFNIVGDFVIALSIEVNGDYRYAGFTSPEEIITLLQQYEFNAVVQNFVS